MLDYFDKNYKSEQFAILIQLSFHDYSIELHAESVEFLAKPNFFGRAIIFFSSFPTFFFFYSL